jgi:glutamine synthetase adenylyltransferase
MAERLMSLGLGAITGSERDPARALEQAARLSPYLERVARRVPEAIERLRTDGAEKTLETYLGAMRATGDGAGALESSMKAMRKAKEAAHLVIAGADLASVWTLDHVVRSRRRCGSQYARRGRPGSSETSAKARICQACLSSRWGRWERGSSTIRAIST